MSADYHRQAGEQIRILVWADFFSPSFKAGGPVKSLEALTDQVPHSFFVVTRNQDLGDRDSFSLPATTWLAKGRRQVWYFDPRNVSHALRTVKAVRRLRADVSYFNSVWSPLFTLLPLLLQTIGLIPRTPLVISPRGELADRAMSKSAVKKRIVGPMVRHILRGRAVLWHATSEEERDSIIRYIGPTRVIVIPNLSQAVVPDSAVRPSEVTPGRFVFFSRVNSKKNLVSAIRAIGHAKMRSTLDVIGPFEEQDYLQQCRGLVKSLGLESQVRFLGALDPHDIANILPQYRAFIFPTWHENFGHVVIEALSAGLPVICSTETPWTQDLLAVGLNVSRPDDIPSIASEIDRLMSMPDNSYTRLTRDCQSVATAFHERQGRMAERFEELFAVAVLGNLSELPKPQARHVKRVEER